MRCEGLDMGITGKKQTQEDTSIVDKFCDKRDKFTILKNTILRTRMRCSAMDFFVSEGLINL